MIKDTTYQEVVQAACSKQNPPFLCDSLVVLLEKAVNNIMILFAREVQSEQNRAM
jgi:hypothetical protein